MSSESWTISNPKGNNRDLHVFQIDPAGREKLHAVLRPGQSCQPTRTQVIVREVARPRRLVLLPDGSYADDPRAFPRNSRRV